jgi:hypothetical protein
MTRIINKCLPAALLLSATVLAFVVFFTGRDNIRLKTFKSETGWGYTVSVDGKVVICQPFIPAIEGNRPFATRSDARKTGRMMIDRFNHGVDPSLSPDDLHKAGIRI